MTALSRTKSTNQSPQIKLRSGLQAGNVPGCYDYCVQEYNRCYANGTPSDTCNDRLPVCQNACSVCAMY
jgi:hypothetical protein